MSATFKDALDARRQVGVIVSPDFACLGHPEEFERANMIETEKVVALLPTREMLQTRLAKAIAQTPNVEIMDVAGNPGRRVWLKSDPDGPGYARQKVYARLWMNHEIVAHPNDAAAKNIEATVGETIQEMANVIRGFVSTFRAYNVLDNRHTVAIRALPQSFPGYLNKRGDESFVRVAPCTDEFYVIVGAYFTITPPGEQMIFASEAMS